MNGRRCANHHTGDIMIMNRKLIAIPAIALTAGLSLAACGVQPPVSPAPSDIGARGGVATSAPASPTPAVVATQAPDLATQVATWMAGPGYTDMMTVEADMTTLSTDATSQDVAAVEVDGSTLATDAQTAAAIPPPIDSADYTTAMNDYATAGNDAATGDFAGATAMLDDGNGLVAKVTAAENAQS